MKDDRPDPDKLLMAIQASNSQRGLLKIYLGMASGVGKTYAMLTDAKEVLKKGVDIVAGYIEPHGRNETESLVKDFEVIPVLKIEHRGIMIQDFNLDAALKRKPEVILVDELAHTNAPGLRHTKRWQDIFELLDAGINVYTTLNIQHLESLNDVISSITGVEVRETVPDSVLTRADTIELIDIPPDELVTRLREGKIYPSDKIQSALDNFFQEGNLLALREIALRKTAEKIDAQILRYRQSQDIGEIWNTSEKVLVAIAPNKFARRLIRAAARIAASKHAALIVVAVETPRYQLLKDDDRRLLEDALHLAQKMGAEVERRYGSDIVQEILNIAVAKNASLIVVGKPIRNRFREFFMGTIADSLIRQSGAIDIHLITGEEEEATSVPVVASIPRPRLWSLCITALITALTTGVCVFIYPRLDLTNLVMIYLLASVSVALRFGRTESIIASILNVLAFDFFFVPPRFSFSVTDFQYVVTFSVMLITSLVMSTLTLRIRLQAKTVAERERRTQALYDAGRKMVGSSDPRFIGEATVAGVQQLIGADASFLHAEGVQLVPLPPSKTHFESLDKERGVAHYVLDKKKPAGIGTDTLPGAAALYLPVATDRMSYGVLGIVIDELFDRSLLPVLELLTQQAALCFERNQFQLESFDAKLIAETQSVRSVLLSSISHDFRTPLTVIEGAASAILQSKEEVSHNTKELADSIKDQSKRLTKLVTNVLSLTRLESAGVKPHSDWQSLEELISTALDKTEYLFRTRNIKINIPKDFPLLYVDASLFEQLLINVFENSGYYATQGHELTIEATYNSRIITVQIGDDGPGFALSHNQYLLNGDTKSRSGSGLGLLICGAIAKIHGGSFETGNRPSGGAVCTIQIPYKEPLRLRSHEA